MLRKNPGLKPLVAEAYEDARLEAAGETDLDEKTFPRHCAYSLDDIMERPVEWPPRD